MENNQTPANNGATDPKKITNQSDKIVNKEAEQTEQEHVHEPTNEEQWAHDVNEEFGDDFVLPEESEDDEPKV